ncbi:iron-sulfur cluster carrier protein ApbC [Thalassotalea sp. PLHSN55]|uniref:iron-sulfur cluster carrier protein ApbC n=1 Tax=Thalassotalea sp. PLHSN55 TaxID=3435888 RepID=UPI003F83E6D2
MFSKLFSSKSDTKTVPQETQEAISQFIESYRCDVFKDGLFSLNASIEISQHKDDIVIAITLPFPCALALSVLAEQLSKLCEQTVKFAVSYDILSVREHEIPGIKNIIAVASGKGGVGKSTTSVNLAYALQAEGAKVGLLDADIYGPSIPTLLGLKDQKPTSADGKLLTPLDKDGITAMSIGFLVDDAEATVWRGPMASRAFGQLLNETSWPALDYLIIDMPPGTGDIQLTLAQSVPVAASVVVTTPQDIALIDAVKGIAMFEQVNVPVLGIVENMSYHLCENCGHQSHLFGQGGGENIASEFHTKLLGQLPLNIDIRVNADNGKSLIAANSHSDISVSYRKIAQNVAAELYSQLDMRSKQNAKVIVE